MTEIAPTLNDRSLELEKGEKVLAELRSDRGRYWRDHAVLALLGMTGAGVVLWALGSDHIAIGSLGAVLALAVRGLYLASEQLKSVWVLTDRRLVLPGARSVMLLEIETLRKLMGDMQIITRAGDKHLIKHLADADGVLALIEQARARRAKRVRD
ncbi:MAG: hypothetical protein JJU15_14100 [Pararhodobacter sp.]|nr:hypothetical protein [Pararhodobacter sp.]